MGGLTEHLVLESFHQNIYFGCRFADLEVEGVFPELRNLRGRLNVLKLGV
jgi:hypothetical protein